MYKESDIVYETPKSWVLKEKDKYIVYKIGITHSVSDSAYKLDSDGLSIAIARANYLQKA